MGQKQFTLKELADYTQSTLVGDPHHRIDNVADLESAGPSDAAFLGNVRYENAMRLSLAGVVFVFPEAALSPNRNYLVCQDPSRAFQKTLEALFDVSVLELTGFEGIHPTAIVHHSAKIGQQVTIGPYAVIDKEAVIGERTSIGPHCCIGPRVTIGTGCYFHAHVTVRERCEIGNRVIIQPGAVIGSCGFGYTQDKLGKHQKLNQVGIVTLEDDVEIGANTTIDRARFKSTRVKRGTKIDNLVQLGHGVVIGQDNIIVAQSGIAGSTETGNFVMIGGQAAINGHIKIGEKIMIAGRAGVTKSLEKPGKYGGVPAISLHEYNRQSVHLSNLEKHVKQLQEIKSRLQALELELAKVRK